MNNQKKVVAFFDFDGTLVYADAIIPYLIKLVGVRKLLAAALYAFFKGLYFRMRGRLSGLDPRTLGKELMLRKLLAGIPLEKAHQAADNMTNWVFWKKRMVDALKNHRAQGHKVVIVTGSLNLYVHKLLASAGIEYDDLLATEMEAMDGVLTGRFAPTGNRVRQVKAAAVQVWLNEHGPFDETWGYGNAPNDVPMLELLQHKVIV